jgi:transposase
MGFTLCRALLAEGISCIVIAPSLVPKSPGDHVKTDKRDAEKLARFFRSGDLTEVHVPDAVTESIKDLERARFDAKNAQTAARQQLNHFLLRHGKRYDGVKRWSPTHLEWIRYLKFEHEAHNRVLVDYLKTVEEATARIERLMKDIAELVQTWTMRPVVEALLLTPTLYG